MLHRSRRGAAITMGPEEASEPRFSSDLRICILFFSCVDPTTNQHRIEGPRGLER